MPINLETTTGFYDSYGKFHPNTALFPSPIPGVIYTQPINPMDSSDYSVAGLNIPYFDLPVLPSLPSFDPKDYIPKVSVNTDPLVLPLLAIAAVMFLGKTE